MRCFLLKHSRRNTLVACLLAVLSILFATAPVQAQTSVQDAAIPQVITPSQQGSQFFVLNKDRTVLGASTFLPSTYSLRCAATGAIAAQATAATPFTFNDRSRYLLEAGLNSSGTETAVAVGADYSGTSCTATSPVTFSGTNATLAAVDTGHQREYVLSDSSGNAPDILTHFTTSGNYYSAGSLTKAAQVSLNTGGRYSAIVVDSTGNTGYVAVTEVRTDTSSGGLWIYDPSFSRAVKVLAPGGSALPAVGAFILHASQSVGGNLLVLVNQDNLASSNLGAPPAVTSPFTIIDLGQLGALLNQQPSAASVTLPFVTRINTTLGYYAIFGAGYNQVDGRLYLVTGGGTSSTSITKQVVRYDPRTPTAPAETVIADLAAVPLAFGTYPQITLNASAGTMQLLTTNPGAVYTVSIAGGDTATAVAGSTFSDGNFQPTFIATNPLMGETYIASASGQVDILTLPSNKLKNGLVLLDGPLSAATPGQSTSVRLQVVLPVVTSDEQNTTITITATAASTGQSFTFATNSTGDSLDLPRYVSGTFPTADTYTLVATFPGTTSYPAITSPPVIVAVGKPLYPTQISATAAASSSTAATATVTLSGTTYAPTGTIKIADATSGSTLATYYLPSGAINNPISVPFSYDSSTTAVTAIYSGDTQNGTSASSAATITGAAAKATTSLTLSGPNSANANTSFNTVVALNSSNSNVPTGQVVLYATPSGSTPGQVGSATTAAAFGAGASVSVSLPAGTYVLQASYAGDANFQSSSSNSINLTVAATGSAAVTLAPTSLSFNTQVGTTSAYKDVVLTNSGSAPLTISSIAVTGTGFAQVNGCPASLSAGDRCTIRVTYSPQSATTAQGSLIVRSSAASSPNAIPLTGTGFTPLSLAASASAFPDTTVGASSILRPTLTLTNNTSGNVTITQIASDNNTDFEPGPGCVNATVASGSSCTVLAIFHPGSAGAKSGNITFTVNGSTLSARFTGKGLASGECLDSDGDGLCDDWEKNGVWAHVTGTGDQFIDLPSMGADPMHKDIFIHVDYMQTARGATGEHSHQLKVGAAASVVQAFKVAPVTNPDGKIGINMHIDCGAACPMNQATGATWGSASKAASLSEQAVLDAVPGEAATSFDWTVFDTNSAAFKATGRSLVFHHTIMAHDQKAGNSSSGISRNGSPLSEFLKGASDLVVSLGSWNNQTGTEAQQSGTLMHELGHNLSLQHGGRDEDNYKPNYLSVMNYNMQTVGIIAFGSNGYLDYSRYKLPSLNEFKLNEQVGLNADPKTFPAGPFTPSIEKYGTYYFCQGDSPKLVGPHVTLALDGPINFNCDAKNVISPLVSSDINGDGFGGTLASNEDWPLLVYSGGAVGGNGVGVAPLAVTPAAEITQEQNSLIVPPYGVAIRGMNSLRTAPASQPTLRFVVSNTGSTADTYTLSASTLAGWAITPGYTSTLTLAPGARGEVALTYTVPATAASGDGDTLIFRAKSQNASQITDSVEVSTYAETSPAPVAVSASTVVFGAQIVGTASTASSVVIVNTGTAAVSFPAITATAEFQQTNTCPAQLAASASCVVNVLFQPTGTDARTGTLSITSSASSTPLVVALRGTATAAPRLRPELALAITATNGLAGQPVSLKVVVAQASGSAVPSGNVILYSNDSVLGQVALDKTGTATYTTPSLTAGAYNLYAAYQGDTEYVPTNTPVSTLVLTDPLQTTTTLKSSLNPAVVGVSVTFTATVASSSPATTPTGTVTFYDGTASLGTGTLTNGSATYTTSALALGAHSITAVYGGDGANLASTSTALTETISAATITLSASPSNLTVTRGSSGSLTITATPTGPFTGSLAFSCGSLPAHASCVFAPSTLNFTASSTPQTVTLTLSTKDATTAMRPEARGDRFGILAALFFPAGLLGLAMRKRGNVLAKSGILMLLLAAFAATAGLSGCGGSSSSNTTSAGTYAIAVTAAANGTTSQVTLNVTVQ